MANQLLTEEQKLRIYPIIDGLQDRFEFKNNPAEYLLDIASGHNIQIKESELFEMSGLLKKNEHDEWMIIVNTDDSPRRKMFTIAHELGHYFLHRDHFDAFVDGPTLQQALGRQEDTKYEGIELEANEFAGCILMPKPYIRKQLADIAHIEPHHVEQLAETFSVSKMAVITRLRNLQYALNWNE